MDIDSIDTVGVHYAGGICVAVTKALGTFSILHNAIASQHMRNECYETIFNRIFDSNFSDAKPDVY